MIETDAQRRWWFATHPDYSRSGGGTHRGGQNNKKVSPEAVDVYVNEHLQYVSGPVAELLKSVKRNFGTESQQARATPTSSHPAADPESYAEYEQPIDETEWKARMDDEQGLPETHTFLDVASHGKVITAPVQTLKALLQSMARGRIVSAAKRRAGKEPGEWKEVPRNRGIEHQSKMSGQEIIERDGKRYIKEYEVNGVKFDDYKDGILYEYKGSQGNLLKNREGAFRPWCKQRQEAREEAHRQLRAAQGTPIVWRVGADQVKGFRKALEDIDGIKIVP
ncbi:MAG: Tox-REase-5 domain-containing protein [Thermodesulfobacteriota bacterium]